MEEAIFLFLTVCLAASSTALCPYDDPDLEPWDSTHTWNDGVPQEGDQVTIRRGMKVVLNTSPPPLASITIEDGGALVWGNFTDLKLTVSYILVTGSFEIGSDDCRFQHNAFIVLTGKSNSQYPPPVPAFGRKFIGVTENGTLEFHGRHKLSWTKLIQTVPAALKTCGIIYNHRDKLFTKETDEGLHVTAFKADGNLYDFRVFGTNMTGTDPAVTFENFINDIPTGSVTAIALNKGFGTESFPERDWERIYTTIETLGGMASGISQIRNIGKTDAYAFITQKGQSSTTKEERAIQKAKKGRAETNRLSITLYNPDLTFNVKSVVREKRYGWNDVDFRVLTSQVGNPIIKLKDNVSTWKVGDQIVVTSTDFNWRQSEVFTIIPCAECAENEVRLDHEFEHMHFGEITHGIDERAEVAMLSRNIKIEGQLEDECYANDKQEEELCLRYRSDTFGGHLRVLRYFKGVHVQQVELVHMGQQRFLGCYPLHFHMCDDADGAWLRDNSIHHSLARCITIHGTDGVEVKGNVCYWHFGHGFFLEDSAEVRNILDGNIGIGTMPGTHLMSDRNRNWCGNLRGACGGVSTFWLTHPHNYVRNNVAAGSDVVGFWYITAKEPIGPSKIRQESRGIVKPGHAFHSRILQFDNNVAHSCGNSGLIIAATIALNETNNEGQLIPVNGLIRGHLSIDPREPPQENGVSVISYVDNYTAYKNKGSNAWVKGYVLMRNCSVADSPIGVTMSRGIDDVHTEITDSLFVGETDNQGEPIAPYTRSLPANNGEEPLLGAVFYQGPMFVTNCHFEKYFHRNWNGQFRPTGAISSKLKNLYPVSANNQVRNITFGFCDRTDGNWVFIGNETLPLFTNDDGMKQINFRDMDGSVTGHKNTQVVKKDRFFTTPRCSNRDSWNMAVCPHRYCKILVWGKGGVLEPGLVRNTPMHLRRDDRPEDMFEIEGQKGLNFLLINGKSYTVYFNGKAPHVIIVQGQNMESGDSVRLGICFPKDTQSFNLGRFMTEVFSVADVDNDQTGRSYFWDQSKGLLVIKLISHNTRVNTETCPGFKCPRFRIERVGGGDGPVNCYEDAYKDGTYNKTVDVATGIPNEINNCLTSPSNGQGAPVDKGSFISSNFSIMCPVLPTDPDRTTPKHKGCYIDDHTYRDVDQNLLTLHKSMTTETCIERCYQIGYAFAALQNGKHCRCGDAYGVYGEDTGGCTAACTGNSEQMCGGFRRNSVYSSGNAPPEPLVACGKSNEGAVINGKCFYLGEEVVSFMEGQRECMKLGGDLATITTADVQEQVVRYLRSKKASAWFGLNDVVTEGVYQFMDGTSLGHYSNFKSGGQAPNEDFGLLVHEALFHWADKKGFENYRYLCQLPFTMSSLTPQACGTNNYGKRIGDGNCYAIINNKANYVSAQYACYTRMGTLAPLSDNATKEDIIAHLYHFGEAGTSYWTGETGAEKGTFKELRYNALYNEFAGKYWAQNGAVCLLETVNGANPCSSGWKQNGKFCYLYTGRYSSSLTQARTICKQGVSDIVTIQSEAENIFVGNLVRNFNPPTTPSVRLGYQYDSASGKFFWVDGTVSNYTNWRGIHGVGKLQSGECAQLTTYGTKFEWKNAKCKGSFVVVCKAPAGS